MNFNKMHTFLAIILACAVFNGCATAKLWQTYDSVKKEKLSATSDQIFYSCQDGRCDQQKLLLPYKLNQTGISLQNAHPPFEQGYIIIHNQKCIQSIINGMKIILDQPAILKNSSMKAKIIKNVKPDGTSENYIDFYIIAKKTKHEIKLDKINANQDDLQNKIANYTDFDEDGTVIPKDARIITLGNRKCKNHHGCMIADINFMDELKFTSANDKWLPVKDVYPFNKTTIVFIYKKTEKIYRKSMAERIVLTPFSVVADIIIVPIALVTFPLWQPK